MLFEERAASGDDRTSSLTGVTAAGWPGITSAAVRNVDTGTSAFATRVGTGSTTDEPSISPLAIACQTAFAPPISMISTVSVETSSC